MLSVLLRYRTWLIAVSQAFLVFASLIFAWLLRFDFHLPYRSLLFSAAVPLIAIRLLLMRRFQLLHGWWRYTGVNDAFDMVKAVAWGSVIFVAFMRLFLDVVAFPRTIYVLESIISLSLIAGVRLLSRIFAEAVRNVSGDRKRIILIGAGMAAQLLTREIKRMDGTYRLIGCVDDDESKWGIRMNGVPVLGGVDALPSLLALHAIDEVLIAIPSATGQQMQRFVAICERCRVCFKTVPALRDIIAGQSTIREFRDVHVEDLLEREAVTINLDEIQKAIEGRTVLITGAAGSIGSELCRQILRYGPGSLICLDQSETGIFYLEQDLTRYGGSGRATFVVADICDGARMGDIFAEYVPDVVFHAAAYKHVPLMERNIQEAVKNNVFALLRLIEIAEESGCHKFVVISSDKAVNPTSVMGVTKRIGELIVSSRPSDGMDCASVRFGNVLGSNGSVIPLFQEQLKSGQPLSITHPEITRFFMTTREAVSLALQAFSIGERGDTLVLDMGQPVSILQLAKTLIRLSGRSEKDVRIQFTGLRPGEKLIEELFYENEQVSSTSFAKIKRIRGTFVSWTRLGRELDELAALVIRGSTQTIRRKLKAIVPEYAPIQPVADIRELRSNRPVPRRKPRTGEAVPNRSRLLHTVGADAD